MIQTYQLADLRKAVGRRPMGWPVFEVGDLYPGYPIPDRVPDSWRTRRRKMHEWRGRHGYTTLGTLAYVGGSAWTWSDSAGTPTFNLTLNALGSGSLRQGVKSTTTIVAPPNATNAVPPDFFSVQITATFTSAPAAGGVVGAYFGFSPSATAGTSNPGGLTGTDAAGTNTDQLPQLAFGGGLVASNNLSTAAQYQTPYALVNADPANSPYVSPEIYNNASVALKSSSNVSTLTVVPYWRQAAA